MSLDKTRPSSYRPTLDGWRAIAILMVIVSHAGGGLFLVGGRYANPALYTVCTYGRFGVDLFFGISGLLICGRLLDEIRKTGGISLGSFYIRRAFRILPPAIAYLVIIGLLAIAGVIVVTPGEWLSSLFFSRNYIVIPAGWYTEHFWSLAVEEHFYLIWPAALLTLGSARRRRLIPMIAIAVAIWRVIDFHFFHDQIWPGVLSDNIYQRTDTRFDSLLWGCWIAMIASVPAYRAALIRHFSGLAIGGLLIVLIGCIVFDPPLKMAWVSFLVPIILVSTVLNPAPLFCRILEASLMRWIGRISYSLYIWQQLFLGEWARQPPLGRIQEWPLNIVATFICAAISYYLLERPLITIGHSLAARFEARQKPVVEPSRERSLI
jgi:peptidoglycan/LPS O-acetylase OafA/YrhL